MAAIASLAAWRVIEPGLAAADPSALVSPFGQVDRVVVRKQARQMELMRKGAIVKTYKIALGFTPTGHKIQEGDGKTPEGNYLIDWRNPNSAFHLSLHISYPDRTDRQQAASRGVSTGGDIFIHGNTIVRRDWTAGCIAVTDREIEEIWAAVPNNTPISILP
jgi:murein L,D-transpeptidase YafK